MKNFYCYIYCDPTKPGNFQFGDLSFSFEPFYVGKGKGNRYLSHLKEAKETNQNIPRLNKIRKILRTGLEPIVSKVLENVTDDEAKSYEMKLIELIGRKVLSEGPLSNILPGGSGGATPINQMQGKKHSPETKRKISEKAKARLADKTNHPGFGKPSPLRGSKLSEDHRHKLKGVSGKYERTNEIKEKISASKTGTLCGSKNPNSKSFELISPDGKEFIVSGSIAKFCEDNDLNNRCLRSVIDTGKPFVSRNKKSKNTHGWQITHHE